MGRTDVRATESNEVQETAAAVARVKDSSNSQRAQNGRHGCGGNVTEVQEKISEDNATPYSNVEKLMPSFTQGGDSEPNLNNESTVVNTTNSVLGHLESKPNKPKATWTRLNRMEVRPPTSASSVIKPTLGKRNMGDTLDEDYNRETEYTSLKRSKLVYIHLRHSFLPQRRAGPRSQMLHKVLKVHLGVSRISLDLARVGAGARPPRLDHDHRNILVAGDGHGANHRVHHHVEEVPVPDAGDQVVAEVERMVLEQGEADRDLGVEPVELVRVDVDQERGVGVAQELEQWLDEALGGWGLELGGGRRERSGDDADEREGGGDGDAADAEVAEGEVDVSDGGEEAGGEARGGGVFVDEVVADGDGCDFGARVEGDDVEVEPAERDGAVGGDGRDQGVGDCEEERGVCVGEGAGESRVWVEDAEGVKSGVRIAHTTTATGWLVSVATVTLDIWDWNL
nr:hypothetical protein CFP56_04813 [Quercus suber]